MINFWRSCIRKKKKKNTERVSFLVSQIYEICIFSIFILNVLNHLVKPPFFLLFCCTFIGVSLAFTLGLYLCVVYVCKGQLSIVVNLNFYKFRLVFGCMFSRVFIRNEDYYSLTRDYSVYFRGLFSNWC